MQDTVTEQDEPFADRWVRVMADHCSDGVWERSGGMGDIDGLPVPEALRARITAWQARYDKEALGEGFDAEDFARDGLEIARAVKAALPDWTVVYFDEARAQRKAPREVFEYEVPA